MPANWIDLDWITGKTFQIFLNSYIFDNVCADKVYHDAVIKDNLLKSQTNDYLDLGAPQLPEQSLCCNYVSVASM